MSPSPVSGSYNLTQGRTIFKHKISQIPKVKLKNLLLIKDSDPNLLNHHRLCLCHAVQ